jgi:ferrous iron transport protein B
VTTNASEKPALTVAVVGNPNSGKTALFNRLTGSNQSVGNFPGVTVSLKRGFVDYRGWQLSFVDLPGTYSLNSGRAEERQAPSFLETGAADLVLNVLDAGLLERNLFLTSFLVEGPHPYLVALNMMDEARSSGMAIDLPLFSTLLGAPVVETVARTGEGVGTLLDAIVDFAEAGLTNRAVGLAYDPHLESAIDTIASLLPPDDPKACRAQAIQQIESVASPREGDSVDLAVERVVSEIERKHSVDVPALFASGRYGFVRGLVQETVCFGEARANRDRTDRLDDVFLHRFFGLPIFFALMWLMFQVTFVAGAPAMEWIDTGVAAFSELLSAVLPEGMSRDLILDGVVAGVGGVLVFLPNIVLLFLFISFFEASGYLARVAFLMDRFMHSIGLHGKAFVPLLMGFGCNVPAIMSARIIEDPRDRLVTILINPFMSCSARLPIYVLFAAAFFPDHAGTVVFAMYFLGIAVAMFAALLLKGTILRGSSEPFVLELPPYRRPTLFAVLSHMWEKALDFLKKVGGIILVGSILIWGLSEFPQSVPLEHDYDAERAVVLQETPPGQNQEVALLELDRQEAAELQEHRYLGRLGKAVDPVFSPLGFEWRESVALLTGFVAKEVVVSTIAVLYNAEDSPSGQAALSQSLSSSMPPHVALAFMVFSLLYLPCLATIAVIRRETRSWGWTGLSVAMSLGFAWGVAFLVVRVGPYFLGG